jgi:anti-sigma factor RsiW
MTRPIPPAAVRAALELHVRRTLGLHVGTLTVMTPDGKDTMPATCRLRLSARVGGRWVEVQDVRGLVEVVADDRAAGVPAVNGAGGE